MPNMATKKTTPKERKSDKTIRDKKEDNLEKDSINVEKALKSDRGTRQRRK